MDSRTEERLPTDGSLLPAPAQSYQDTAALPESLYCYQLVPWSDAGALGVSDQLCLYPNTRSATGAPPTFTLQLHQSNMASLSWSAPGGQGGYMLQALPETGAPRLISLPADATSATDDTGGQPTSYVLVPTLAGVALGQSDVLSAVPGQATVGAGPASGGALQGLTPSTLATRAHAAAEALRRPEVPRLPRRSR
jgi:hypothetical protein